MRLYSVYTAIIIAHITQKLASKDIFDLLAIHSIHQDVVLQILLS